MDLSRLWNPCELAAGALCGMLLTHLVAVCDGVWVQAPGGQVPDDRVRMFAFSYDDQLIRY